MHVTAEAREEVAATAVVLAFGAFSQRRLGKRTQVPANLLAAIALLALARERGASWSALGLERADVPRGFREGAIAAIPLAAVIAIGVGLPITRELFVDERIVDATRREALFEVLVRIPLATAVAEELLFRSALFGLSTRQRSTLVAVASTSLAFGVWHLAPALHAHAANPAGAELASRVGGAPASVAATVAVTAGAGVAFAALRVHSRSVVAPIVAHAALNAVAFLAARWAGSRAGHRSPRRR